MNKRIVQTMRKRVCTLVLITLVLINTFAVLGAVETSEPTPEALNQVAYEYDDGTYTGSAQVATISQSDKNVYSGFLFPDIVIPINASITQANLTLYYWNNLNFSYAPVNLFIEGILGEYSVIYPGLLRSPPVTTTAYYTYDISGWDTEGNKTLDITNVIKELQASYSWNETGQNILIRIQALAPVGPWPPGSEPSYYRYEVSTNHGPANQSPVLDISYDDSGESVEYYKGYTITSNNNTGEFSAIIIENKLYHYSYEAPIGWDNYSLPQALPVTNTGASEKAWAVGSGVYALLCNATRVDLWYANKTDLSSWFNLGAVRTVQPSDYCLTYNEGENTLYCYSLDQVGPMYYRVYNITSGAWANSATLIITTGAFTSSGLDSCYDPVNEYVWVAFTTPDATASNRHLYIYNCSNASYHLIFKGNSELTTHIDQVNIDYYNEKIWTFSGHDASTIYYRYYDVNDFTSSGWVSVVNDSPLYSETVVTTLPYRLYYITDRSAADQQKRVYRFDTNDLQTYMTPLANYTLSDQLMAQKLIHSGSEYLMLEIEQVNELYMFSSPAILSSGAGVSFTKSAFWSLYESGLSPLNVANYGGMGSSVGYFSFTVTTPPGGDPPDPDCLALATTVEEVKACIDSVLTDDPDNPGGGDFTPSDPWYVSRKQFKLYFLALGMACLILPWVSYAINKDPSYLVQILFINSLGIALLIAMMET